MGILIEKSPQELGFPHRVFQEFLAARFLSTLPFDDQERKVSELFASAQWHDVLLCLCHLNRRTGEVDQLVNAVVKIPLPPELEPARQIFLAEVAFGDLHCSASVASDLAKQAFTEIESGAWMPQRERLLERALDGLFSDVLRDETEGRIRSWYPERHGWSRGAAYRAMAKWPQAPETREALWKGLLDEEEWNQRAAAEALASNLGGDAAVGERLLGLLRTPTNAISLSMSSMRSVSAGRGSQSFPRSYLRHGRLPIGR